MPNELKKVETVILTTSDGTLNEPRRLTIHTRANGEEYVILTTSSHQEAKRVGLYRKTFLITRKMGHAYVRV